MSYKIVYGDRTFTAKDIKEGNCFIGNSIAGDELTIDTLDVTVKSFDTQFFPLTDSDGYLLCDSNGHFLVARPRLDDLTQYVYGEPVYYYHDDVLIGKFFLSSVMRVGLIHYKLSCISGVGLLDNTQHYGGMYTGQALSDVVADIISGTVEYSIDEAYQSIPVYNWLPIGTRRENLHQLLFVTGLALKKDANGIIRITALTDGNPTEIGESRLFSGGSIDYNAPSTAVSVAEHTYIAFASDETVTLFSGEAAAEDIITPNGAKVSGVLVPFDNPIHDLQIDNGEILESGVNYAVLAQSSDCLLTGQKYTHIVREILRGEAGASKDNTATVTDATLVNLANSENVAERVLAYYSKARTVSNDLVVGTERPGDPISMDDPFGDPMTGIINPWISIYPICSERKPNLWRGTHPPELAIIMSISLSSPKMGRSQSRQKQKAGCALSSSQAVKAAHPAKKAQTAPMTAKATETAVSLVRVVRLVRAVPEAAFTLPRSR